MGHYRALTGGARPDPTPKRELSLAEYLATAQLESNRLAEAALAAGLDAAVPTCPGWTVGELLRHVGGLARGVTDYLRTQNPHPPTEADKQSWFAPPPEGTDLVVWYLEIRAELADAFQAANPQAPYFSFLPAPSPLLFWARRDVHETAIHRADVQLATGAEITPYDADFAYDGIAELIDYTTSVLGLDLRPDLLLVGPPSDVYLTLWNRKSASGLYLIGDVDVLALWRTQAKWEL
ncbi:maleylpyruvate isomerase family mycothiol-dependent enzyme [Kribbella sp. NPDC055071]